MEPDPRTIAHRLTQRGLVVIPVPRAGTLGKDGKPLDGKTPVIPWKRYQTTRPTPRELKTWFTTGPTNFAVLTGALSGVVVVDVDSVDGLDWAEHHLPDTPWMSKTAKGLHLWYQHPGHPVPNRVRLPTDEERALVDVRGDGGFVMAPGSLHESGVWYRGLGDWMQPRNTLPVFDPAWLPTPIKRPHDEVTNEERRHRDVTFTDVRARARAYLAAIPPPEIGYGSDLATFTAACRLVRGFALSEADAIELLWAWAGSRPGWDRAWIETKVRSALLHGQEKIGAML